MKAGWKTKTLAEVLEKTETTNPLLKPDDEFDYIDVSSVSNQTFTINETQRLVGQDAPSRARKLVKTNDILFATIRPTLQRVAIVPPMLNRQVCSTGYFVLRPKAEVDHRFLFYYLFTKEFMAQMADLQKGASYPAVTDAEVRAQFISYPESIEQQRIVTILDEAFASIATARAAATQNLQHARALFESHLQSVFSQKGEGWTKAKLESITTKIGSGATPRGGGEAYKNEGVSLIRSLNVHDLQFKYAKLAFLDELQANELSNVKIQSRDVLLNITGASVARCCIVPDDVLPARVNQHVSIIRPKPEVLVPEFLHYLLISKLYKDKLLTTGEEGGSTRQAITKAQIQKFAITFPKSIEEQARIVAGLNNFFEESQRLESIYQRKIQALDELKQSLLQQAFSGQLTADKKTHKAA